MALFFLIPLFTGLIGGYIFKKCTDEIGHFIGIFAVVCIVLSLVLAPWQILLLLLIFTLVTTKKLLQQNEYKMNHVDEEQEKLDSSDNQEQVLSKPKNSNLEMIRRYRGAIY
jgi:phosphate/sulfate permease